MEPYLGGSRRVRRLPRAERHTGEACWKRVARPDERHRPRGARKTLEAGYSRYVQDKRIPRLRYGEFPLFAVAAAGVIYCYQKRIDASAIRGTVRSMLGWMWGPC